MTVFCPIYKQAAQTQPWKSANTANSGLVFEKFGDAWKFTSDRGLPSAEFDKGGVKKEDAGKWLSRFTGPNNKHGDPGQLSTAAERQYDLIHALTGRTILIQNNSRFVTGMGRQHPLENGFSWHHTLGTPYLPGTSLKGMLRSWYREAKGDWGPLERPNRGNGFREDAEMEDLFGIMGEVGDLILFDMLPKKPVELVAEIMTPHFGPYYAGKDNKELPGDWHSPVPISYLTVAEGQTWQLGVAPRTISGKTTRGNEIDIDRVVERLVEGLQYLGLGAKTNSGMGRFSRLVELEQKESIQRERNQAKRDLAAAQATEDAQLTPELRQLVTLARQQSWREAANSSPFLDGMDQFLSSTPNPSQAVIDWIRQNVVESDQVSFNKNWKDIWKDPDAMKGKKKDKAKYKGRIKDLVVKLKELYEANQ